jgi:hypothetical protein
VSSNEDNEPVSSNEDKVLASVNPDLVNRVSYHPANEVTIPMHEAVRAATLAYMTVLDQILPEGREKSLAFTQAEQAMFWANAAVARSGAAPQEPAKTPGRPRKDGQPTQPRTAAEKAKTEVWDEDDQEWKPKGRGRLPKGAVTRLVDPKTGDVIED